MAYRAIRILESFPSETIPYLAKKLSKAQLPDPTIRIRELIKLLDHDSFVQREQASAELVRIGQIVEPFLDLALKADPSNELVSRVKSIRERILRNRLVPLPELLQVIRALETLQRINTPEASGTLREIATKARTEAIRREATTVLEINSK